MFRFFTLLGCFALLGLMVFMPACGGHDFHGEAWSETVIGAISGAAMLSEGTGSMAYAPPKQDGLRLWAIFDQLLHPIHPAFAELPPVPPVTVCPLINNPDPALSKCSLFNGGAVLDDAPGASLRLYYNVCQFGSTMQERGWWRTYRVIHFPDLATCEAVRQSAGGLTESNVQAFDLTGKTLKLTYGMGPGGDQDNFRLSTTNELQLIYSDFPSGWLEDTKKGGVEVVYTSTTTRELRIKGMHIMGYIRKDETQDDPQVLFDQAIANGLESVVSKTWDHTISTAEPFDRFYNTNDPGSDTKEGPSGAPIVVVNQQGARQITQGRMRTQHNYTITPEGSTTWIGYLGISDIAVTLEYTDPTCCWPKKGKVVTNFSPIFRQPTEGNGSFDREEVLFLPDGLCGQVQITHSEGGDPIDNNPYTFQLSHCH